MNRAPGVVRVVRFEPTNIAADDVPPMVGEKKRVSIRSGDQSLGNRPNTDCLGFVWSPKIGMTEPTYKYLLHTRRIMNILVRIQYFLSHQQQIILSRFSGFRTETCAKVPEGPSTEPALDANRLRTPQNDSCHRLPHRRPGLRHLGPDDIVLSDVGAHKMWIARYYQCETANTCLISNGFCSMGFALPGAMGAKVAHPDRRVLAIAGDAGFLMNVQDLETLVRYKQNVVIMIWADGEYGLIKWKQQNHFDGRHSDLAFNNPDFELLAKSFGAWGRILTGPGQLPDALDEAFRQPGPALLAVPVDYAENVKLSQRLGNLNFSI